MFAVSRCVLGVNERAGCAYVMRRMNMGVKSALEECRCGCTLAGSVCVWSVQEECWCM